MTHHPIFSSDGMLCSGQKRPAANLLYPPRYDPFRAGGSCRRQCRALCFPASNASSSPLSISFSISRFLIAGGGFLTLIEIFFMGGKAHASKSGARRTNFESAAWYSPRPPPQEDDPSHHSAHLYSRRDLQAQLVRPPSDPTSHKRALKHKRRRGPPFLFLRSYSPATEILSRMCPPPTASSIIAAA